MEYLPRGYLIRGFAIFRVLTLSAQMVCMVQPVTGQSYSRLQLVLRGVKMDHDSTKRSDQRKHSKLSMAFDGPTPDIILSIYKLSSWLATTIDVRPYVAQAEQGCLQNLGKKRKIQFNLCRGIAKPLRLSEATGVLGDFSLQAM
jgi:hypothetical protein